MQKELSIIGCFGLLLAVYATPALSASAYMGPINLSRRRRSVRLIQQEEDKQAPALIGIRVR
jgi:hypothetical protein